MSFTNERFLIEAIEQCQLMKIINYIKYGHNIHVQNTLGQNLLVHTLKQQNVHDPFFDKKRLQVFQFLITSCHLDFHRSDHHGKNVFNWATNLNCTQEALYLLRSYPGDIDIRIRDRSGLCSLHYAIEHGNEILVHAIVNYLLQYRIRFDIKDNHNNTPEELARKLGYDYLGDYLEEASRSTVFMSREIPLLQQRLLTNKTKGTVNTRSSTNTLPLSVLDSTEFHNLAESKIEAARNSNEWKNVALLRVTQRNSNEKRINRQSIPTIHVNRPTTSSVLPKITTPIHTNPSSSSNDGPVHMFHLMEPQISSSYRQAFVPECQQTLAFLPAPIAQRKMSTTSSHRMSLAINHRKRDSNTSHLHAPTPQDGHTRLSLPPVYKQRRQSIVHGRLSDGVGLAKLRSKPMIAVHN